MMKEVDPLLVERTQAGTASPMELTCILCSFILYVQSLNLNTDLNACLKACINKLSIMLRSFSNINTTHN